ncbi:MAG: hypothetical protein P4L69_05050 [Desulfosporosinus sp.]|nr:hypothetical protein [Desulfosporosinus sp.]
MKSYPIDSRGVKRPLKALEAQVGGIVDMDCAKINTATDGTYFSAPSPGSALMNIGPSLLSIEVLNEQDILEGWKRRLSDYMSYSKEDALEVEDAWTCSSASRWYGSVPGFKTRGATKTGFILTKPIMAGRIVSLAQFVIDKEDMPTSAMAVARAVVNWDAGKWERMETRFSDDSGLREMLKRVVVEKDGLVPIRISAGSIGVVLPTKRGESVRPVFLPILPSEVQLVDTSPAALDQWVTSTMRDIWIEIVADVQTLADVTEYKPSSKFKDAFKIFSLGVGVGPVLGMAAAAIYGLGATGILLTGTVAAIPGQMLLTAV